MIVKRGRVSYETSTFETERAPDGREARAGGLIVRFKRAASGADRLAAHQVAGALKAEKLRARDAFRVQVGRGALARARAAYRARSDVDYAEYDYVRRVSDVPNDPNLGLMYGLDKIEATDAWDTTHSSASVKVAILDCGIYSSSSTYLSPDGQPGHPDLRDKVVAEAGFAATPDVDDWCDHGSHVAGTAAADTNNALGVAGVGFDASLLNGKVLDDTGSGSDSTVADGLYWAADQGAKVINLSLGGPGPCTQTLQDAIDYAWSHGAVIVAAAGNAGNSGAQSPGNCNHVIAVAATDANDARAGFSNYGSNVDVAAPGVNILSTNYTGSYIELSGTSMASPHVAGLAALIWSTSYGSSNQAVVDRIETGADAISGTGSLWQHGRINAAQSVQPPQAPPLAASYSSSPPTSWGVSQQQSYSVQVTNTGSQTWSAGGANPVRLGIHFMTSASGWSWATDQRFTLPNDLAPGQSATLNVTVQAPASSGAYFLKHRLVKEGVAWFDQEQTTNVTVNAPPLAASYNSSPPTTWTTDEQQTYSVQVTNTGSQTWNAGGANPVRLGVHFTTSASGWSWATDQRFVLPNDVAPGQTATLNVNVRAPSSTGAFFLKHRLVKEGVAWFDQTQTTNVTVNAPPLAASYNSSPPTSWVAGEQQSYSVQVTNTGSQTWSASGANRVRLGIHFATSATGWSWATDQRFVLPNDLAPGQSATLNVTVQAPANAGAFFLKHRLVKEGVAWFDQAQTTNVTVAAPALAASYSSSPPTSWTTLQQQTYSVQVTNTGSQTWNAVGPNQVRLGIHFATSATGWNWATDQRFVLPNDVATGETVALNVTVQAPPNAGAYFLKHRMVKEGIAWFGQAQVDNVTVN